MRILVTADDGEIYSDALLKGRDLADTRFIVEDEDGDEAFIEEFLKDAVKWENSRNEQASVRQS